MEITDDSECPKRPNLLPGCEGPFSIGELCEGNGGECGTKRDTLGCGNYEVYKNVECMIPPVLPKAANNHVSPPVLKPSGMPAQSPTSAVSAIQSEVIPGLQANYVSPSPSI